MRLKNIKLAGFKSFVDPTNVQLNTNMVAVIGPNGCGKSNIIDAVRWVMGESSARNLRGDTMDDVIFSGSSSRSEVSHASIELIFDNSLNKLESKFAKFNEILIRREANRDGSSSYYLNNTRCRRKDIREVFLGTGLGSLSIFNQGSEFSQMIFIITGKLINDGDGGFLIAQLSNEIGLIIFLFIAGFLYLWAKVLFNIKKYTNFQLMLISPILIFPFELFCRSPGLISSNLILVFMSLNAFNDIHRGKIT